MKDLVSWFNIIFLINEKLFKQMIDNFLIISCIGKDDKLGLRINKEFFVYNFDKKEIIKKQLVLDIYNFLNSHKAILN